MIMDTFAIKFALSEDDGVFFVSKPQVAFVTWGY
jgi:hypothetical protein